MKLYELPQRTETGVKIYADKEIAARKADELAEAEMYRDMADWMKDNPLEAEL